MEPHTLIFAAGCSYLTKQRSGRRFKLSGHLYKLSAARDDEKLGLAIAALGNVRRRSATFGRDLVGVAREDETLGRPELTFGRGSATFDRFFLLLER